MEIQLEDVWPLLLLVFLVLNSLYYYYRFWLPVLRYKDVKSTFNTVQRGVSVIVSAHNQAENITKFLPALLSQNYPDFEVIVINDRSYDESSDVLMEFQTKYPNLRVLTVEEQPKYPTGKKFALTLGVKAAKHEVLLFTDADCKPNSEFWIQKMQRQYIDKAEIVLGHVQQEVRPGLLNALIRFDSLNNSLHSFGHAITRRAFTASGGNLSYLRNLFFFHKGFVAHIKHPAGDDDLFVNAAATMDNARVSLDPDTFTVTLPKTSWTALFRQKYRQLSSSKFYKKADQWWMGYTHSINWLMVIVLAFAVWFYQAQPVLLAISASIFALSVLHRYLFLGLFARRVLDQSLIIWLPVVLPLHQLFQLFWGIKGRMHKPRW